jgi:hypothetical protein
MPSRTFQIVREAIHGRQQVHAYYKGYRRQMYPHAVGYKNGREKALFYQFGGGSSTGIIPPGDQTHGPNGNWRCVFLDELHSVEVVDGPWHTAANHSRDQTCIDDVVEEITPSLVT